MSNRFNKYGVGSPQPASWASAAGFGRGAGGSALLQARELLPGGGVVRKDLDGLLAEVRAIRNGGGNGSIVGRNTFQRPRDEAIAMLSQIIDIYRGKD